MIVSRDGWDETWRRVLRRISSPDPSGDADVWLAALSDISGIRGLLEQGELVCVRAARRHGTSWAEIATHLGVTRQSAWERWHEIDGPAALSPGQTPEPTDPGEDILESVVDETARELVDGAVHRPSAPAPGRRPAAGDSLIVVPDVVGLSCDDAHGALAQVGLIAVAHGSRGKPKPLPATATGVVTDQVPQAGARRRVASFVTVWFDAGGGPSGVREPRRPRPAPKSAAAEYDSDPTASST